MDYSKNKADFASANASIETTRANLHTAVFDFADRCVQNEFKNKKKKLVMAVQATVGVGKSRVGQQLVTHLQKHGIPSVVCVPTRKLINEWVTGIGGDARAYRPREAPIRLKDGTLKTTEFTCYMMHQVQHAGANNHRPAQSLCKNCPYGMAMNLAHVDKEKADQAVQWFRKNDLRQSEFQPCRFLGEGNPRQMQSDCLVMPFSAFSEAAGFFTDDIGVRQKRFAIFDESFPVARPIQITPSDISKWTDSLLNSKNILLKMRETEDELQTIDAAIDVFNKLSGSITLNTQIPSAEILALHERIQERDEMAGGTARWEAIKFTSTDRQYQVALRAFNAIAHSVKADAEKKIENGLYVFESSPILDWVLQNGNSILMDATMPLNVRQILDSAGAEFHDAQSTQNIRVTKFKGQVYGKGRTELEGFKRTAMARMRDIEQIVAQDGEWAVLTHKSTLAATNENKSAKDAAADFTLKTGAEIGWFGNDERGHNRWAGKNIALVGMSILSPVGIHTEFAKARAAMLFAGLKCEEFDGRFDDGARTNGLPFPIHPHVRNWLIDLYCQNLVQAIGRARAAGSERTIQIQLWGGLDCEELDAALAGYGVKTDEVLPNLIHNAKKGRIRSATGRDVIADAIGELQNAGEPVSRLNVRARVVAHRFKANDKEIDARIFAMRQAGELPLARRGRRVTKTTHLDRELIGWNAINNIYSHSTQLNTEQESAVDAVAESARWVRGIGNEVAEQAVETAEFVVNETESSGLTAPACQDLAWSSDYSYSDSDYFSSPEYHRNVLLDEGEAVDPAVVFIAGAGAACDLNHTFFLTGTLKNSRHAEELPAR